MKRISIIKILFFSAICAFIFAQSFADTEANLASNNIEAVVTPHNVINLNTNQPLKIISVYSATDIPANAVYKKKSDEPQT